MSTVENSLSMNPDRPPRREANVLPTVLRMRAQVDAVFTRYVGPIASELCAEEFSRWRTEGQLGPGGLHRYISRLARYITDDAPRHEFLKYASACIRLSSVRKS